MKNKYFNLVNELLDTIKEMSYNQMTDLGADLLLPTLKNIKILEKYAKS